MKLKFNLTQEQTNLLCYGLGCKKEDIHYTMMSSLFGYESSLFYRQLGFCQKNIQKYLKLKRKEEKANKI